MEIIPFVVFTVEINVRGVRPVLDTLLRRLGDGSQNIAAYRKLTNANQYVGMHSIVPYMSGEMH